MLLARHRQRLHLLAQLRVDAGEAILHRRDPRCRILLAAAVIGTVQLQRCAGRGQQLPLRGVIDHDFQALRARVDTGDDAHAAHQREAR